MDIWTDVKFQSLFCGGSFYIFKGGSNSESDRDGKERANYNKVIEMGRKEKRTNKMIEMGSKEQAIII